MRPYLGDGKLSSGPRPRAWPLGKAGLAAASWVPGGCSHPLPCALSQVAAPDLANLPAHLIVVPCCHIDQILNKPNTSQKTFKLVVEYLPSQLCLSLTASKRPPAESTFPEKFVHLCPEEQTRSVQVYCPSLLLRISVLHRNYFLSIRKNRKVFSLRNVCIPSHSTGVVFFDVFRNFRNGRIFFL